jgi:hypothetical protein
MVPTKSSRVGAGHSQKPSIRIVTEEDDPSSVAATRDRRAGPVMNSSRSEDADLKMASAPGEYLTYLPTL